MSQLWTLRTVKVREALGLTIHRTDGLIMVQLPEVNHVGYECLDVGHGIYCALRFSLGFDLMDRSEIIRGDVFTNINGESLPQQTASLNLYDPDSIDDAINAARAIRGVIGFGLVKEVMELPIEDLILVMVGIWPGDPRQLKLPRYVESIAQARLQGGF